MRAILLFIALVQYRSAFCRLAARILLRPLRVCVGQGAAKAANIQMRRWLVEMKVVCGDVAGWESVGVGGGWKEDLFDGVVAFFFNSYWSEIHLPF